jgi:lipopolysaccharide/colanic/teichoic acid biosynthesis glycosyltransferase
MNARFVDGKIKIMRVITRLIIGGPTIHVVNLDNGLDKTRYESILVSGKDNPEERSMLDYAVSRGIRPVIIPEMVGEFSFKIRDIKALIKLYRLIRREKPHIVHTHTAKAGFLGRVAAWLAGVPLIIHTYHGHILHGYFGPIKSWALQLMERTLARITDQIIAVSDQVKQDLVDYAIARQEKITVVPLGFDLSPFLTCQEQRGQFRKELGLKDEVKLIGIVGRIVPIKNHRLFLDAAACLIKEQPTVRFVIVGDGNLRYQKEQYAASLGISDKVIFTGWRRDLSRIYADLDVLVVSSDNEGTPVSAIEAMASGCPVVATRVGGMQDLIQDGETGFLVPPKDAGALAISILNVLQKPDSTFQMVQVAREVAKERFSVQRLIKDTEHFYREIINNKNVYINSYEPILKRYFDILLSGLGLIGSAPMWALFALLVKLSDGGPVFFKDSRIGKNSRKFSALKFRTMVPDADARFGPYQARENDPRVTRLGRWLRQTAMDELPQLWNIFRGDMSFVGPRALRADEIELKSPGPGAMSVIKTPGFDLRHRVRPGLTGLAQVYVPRDATRRQKLRFDLLYVRRQSFFLDLKLIALSFWITFRGKWESREKKV